MKHPFKITRRSFLHQAAAAGVFSIVPRHVLGGTGHTPPSEKLHLAIVGCGGRGENHITELARYTHIVALCDVDTERAGAMIQRHPKAQRYRDYRVMLEKQKDIDAVVVATPSHIHAVITLAAMRAGKGVYCEKPLTHTVEEARAIAAAAAKYPVATQMGNQGHAGVGIRFICEWIWDGALGSVREVDIWTDRPHWPQGVDRPLETPPVPNYLDWDSWIGPAPMRPYHPTYHPYTWKGWYDFGTGALGEIGCHTFDPAYMALKLGEPESIEACATPSNYETYPLASIVRYQFPARGEMPPVTMTWYDGGLMPPRPEDLEPERKLPANGALFRGDKASLICGMHCESPRIIPEAKMQAYARPKPTLSRSPGHHEEWLEACKGGPQPGANFTYAGRLTELVLLGCIAQRLPQRRLLWDAEKRQFSNDNLANVLMNKTYRTGWELSV